MSRKTRQPGFTVIELMMVVASVGVLMSLLLPALNAARRVAMKGVCANHLHQLGLAGQMYLNDHQDRFWPYFLDVPGGRQWWFGFEPGGPQSFTIPDRPLDRSKSLLAPYLDAITDQFQCPAFPYDDPEFFPKFQNRAASFGFNLHLSEDRMTQYDRQPTKVFVFADAIHFDQPGRFNEGHYVQHTPNAKAMSGYAHFRHGGVAQLVMMDGHVEAQRFAGDVHKEIADGPAGNLVADDGSNTIYGQ